MSGSLQGLFERWMTLERSAGRSMSDILADLNRAAGTNYKHNWPSVVASRNFELERCPVEVRRYMMRQVLESELSQLGVALAADELDELVIALT